MSSTPINRDDGEHGPIVVLADDDEDARALLMSAVRSDGFRVYEASDGGALVECIEGLLARGERVSLVLSDINMPEPDGIEATKKLRKLDASLRVILMSAFASASVVKNALQAGAERVLRKPLALSTVLGLLPAAP